MTGKLLDLTFNPDGTQTLLIALSEDAKNAFDALKGFPVEVEIRRAKKARSMDANAMCWALCGAIGNAMTPPLPKEEVYRTAIKAVGVFTPVTVYKWDIQTIRNRWESHGVGWFVEVADDAGTGKSLLHLYYGSSTYSVDEMRVLLDWLVDTAEDMGIVIPLSRKRETELLERWGKR